MVRKLEWKKLYPIKKVKEINVKFKKNLIDFSKKNMGQLRKL